MFTFWMSFGHVVDCKHYIYDESCLFLSRNSLHDIQSVHFTSGGHEGSRFVARNNFMHVLIKKWIKTELPPFWGHVKNWNDKLTVTFKVSLYVPTLPPPTDFHEIGDSRYYYFFARHDFLDKPPPTPLSPTFPMLFASTHYV